MNRPSVLIIGAGVIGCTLAWRLARSGCSVTVVERNSSAGTETSFTAGGIMMYCASASRPRQWHALASRAIESHHRAESDLLNDIPGTSPWRWCGRLDIAIDPKELGPLQDKFNADKSILPTVRWLDAAEIHQLEPRLSKIPVGGYFNPEEGQVFPLDYVNLVADAAKKCGAVFRFDTPVEEIIIDDASARGVKTPQAKLEADIVIVAAGPWSADLDPSNVLTMDPVRGQILYFETHAKRLLEKIVYHGSFYMAPRDTGIMVGSTLENVGFEKRCHAGAISRFLSNALNLLPELADCTWEETKTWCGFRPKTSDDIPLIGPDTEIDNLGSS